nr:MAG TPA: hypothetical protein [Caudoviricetes sp.]
MINFGSKFQIKKNFGRAFPNWRARVIPMIAISGFLAFVSKNPTRFRRGSMSSFNVCHIVG